MTPPPNNPLDDNAIRPHVYDGIQEFDKRLPNWWLFTLYITIVYWVGYWGYYEWFKAGPDGPQEVAAAMAQIEAARLASAPATDDASLWKMSRNALFVEAGRATYTATCASCHHEKLLGGIGPNLVDQLWVHGGRPTEILAIIDKGVLAKGMPPWGPVIGPKKAAEVTAFILSHHREGEPILKQDAWVPIVPGAK
jgi:cytochrome c oxidase cbb3-type subunit 3